MARGFERQDDGTLDVLLEPFEQVILASLLDQISHLLAPDEPMTPADDPLSALLNLHPDLPVAAPSDPVLARLLPDAYRDDVNKSAEFRRYTETDLRREKVRRIAHVRAALTGLDEPMTVAVAEAEDWLRALNDLRLALGTRLGVTDEGQDDVSDDEAPVREVYDWLGWLQESLLRAIAPGDASASGPE